MCCHILFHMVMISTYWNDCEFLVCGCDRKPIEVRRLNRSIVSTHSFLALDLETFSLPAHTYHVLLQLALAHPQFGIVFRITLSVVTYTTALRAAHTSPYFINVVKLWFVFIQCSHIWPASAVVATQRRQKVIYSFPHSHFFLFSFHISRYSSV